MTSARFTSLDRTLVRTGPDRTFGVAKWNLAMRRLLVMKLDARMIVDEVAVAVADLLTMAPGVVEETWSHPTTPRVLEPVGVEAFVEASTNPARGPILADRTDDLTCGRLMLWRTLCSVDAFGMKGRLSARTITAAVVSVKVAVTIALPTTPDTIVPIVRTANTMIL
jgi:hypothetical protein